MCVMCSLSDLRVEHLRFRGDEAHVRATGWQLIYCGDKWPGGDAILSCTFVGDGHKAQVAPSD
jgi:hypothetical protein